MFQKKIQDAYETLSPRFKSLANFILENTLDVGFLTATELAHRVSVDAATVVRFAQELGYTGFRELSREIKKYVNEQIALRNRKGLFQQEGIEAQAAHIIDDMSDRMLDMKVDVSSITEVATILSEAHQIYITGTPVGYGIAQVWCTYLKLTGLVVQCFEVNAVQAALLLRDAEKDTVLVGVALGLDPGAEISRLFKEANHIGLKTIAITTSPSLQVARDSTINLVANAKTPLDFPSFDTLATLLSTLWQLIMLYNESRSADNVNQTLQGMDALFQHTGKRSHIDSEVIKRVWGK